MRGLVIWVVVVCAACGAHLDDADRVSDAEVKGDGSGVHHDAGVDAGLGPWSTPVAIAPAATAAAEDDGTMSSNTLELYFGVIVGAGSAANKDLYVTTRTSVTAAWGPATALTALNTAFTEESPRLSPDDLTLYFGSHRTGAGDIYMSTRTAIGAAWSAPVEISGVNTAVYDKWFSPCIGGHYLVVQDHSGDPVPTSNDIYEGTIGGGPPVAATELNSASSDTSAFLSANCLTAYFASGRDGGTNLYTATRASVTATWSTPVKVTDFEPTTTPDNEQDPWISIDGRTFEFASDRADIGGNNTDIFISTR